MASSCADLAVVKSLIQSVASDNVKWATADIKDYYLMTTLTRSEYLRIKLARLPQAIIDKYSLAPFIHNDSVLFEVTQGMYGLPQAGLLAQQALKAHLAAAGYHEQWDVPCLFRHDTNSITFALVVDDFGIKYTDRADLDHLIATLREKYTLKVDLTGKQYLGITIAFEGSTRCQYVDLYMPGAVDKIRQRFAPELTRGAPSPAIYIPPRYGAQAQQVPVDNSPQLSPARKLWLQQLVGCFLYYARAVDYTMLPAVCAISSDQANATDATLAAAYRLIAYAMSYPDNRLRLYSCDMIVHLQADGSFQSRSNGRSVAGGFGFFGNRDCPMQINGAIQAHSTVIDCVVASVGECEYASTFIEGRAGEWLRTIGRALGYPQPPTILHCDNACAVGLANNTVKIRRTRSIDTRFHWMRCRVRQGHFIVKWCPGANMLADFFTKPLSVKDHQALMKYLVHTPPATTNPFHGSRASRGAAWKFANQPTLHHTEQESERVY